MSTKRPGNRFPRVQSRKCIKVMRNERHHLYKTWAAMKRRCYYKPHKSYHNYGGRGIYVCDRWMSFKNFRKDMGIRPIGCTLDRINNDGPYSPENCRWATPKEQINNSRRVKIITFGGKSLCMSDWAKSLGISDVSFNDRVIRHGPDIAISMGCRKENSGGIR